MSVFRKLFACTLVVLLTSTATIQGQDVGAAAAPQTLWRFMGIPQGFQRIRDATANRRGNRPRMERRPAMKRIADPANLASEDLAIKAAAEIKQAEDMKRQKIKAIKYLASVGCGCYDKEGKITDALIAAMNDCTPDVRLASIEAIEEAASGECCRKCGSTSCCNEKVNKQLSDMAYERDDSGCPIEANEEVRQAAKRVLARCCPGGPPTGPIEEEVGEPVPTPDPDPGTGEEEESLGETDEEDDESLGESANEEKEQTKSTEGEDDTEENLELKEPLKEPSDNEASNSSPKVSNELVWVQVQPASFSPASFDRSQESAPKTPATTLRALSKDDTGKSISITDSVSETRNRPYRTVHGKVFRINHASGELLLQANKIDHVNPNGSVDVFHRYLTGERKVGQLKINQVGSNLVKARVVNIANIDQMHVGDRVILR